MNWIKANAVETSKNIVFSLPVYICSVELIKVFKFNREVLSRVRTKFDLYYDINIKSRP